MINAKKRERAITEEDVSQLLQRYSATTILALLQEIGQFSGVKIDWNALAKKTSTGISCPKEYQMLWRHLAYHHSLVEKLEDDAEPLDDDSDLEFELEAFPAVSTEASAEAAACVKVLMSSGLPNDPSIPNRPTVEAPLTINIPNGQASDPLDKQQIARSIRGLNITIPVSVHKQPLPSVTTAEGLEGNGPTSSRQPAKKKRKLWTREEDMELIAAVQKCGEGNWQNILKEDFKHERTASQLSQRWSILRKSWGKSTIGTSGNSNNSTLSEAQLSARQAISMALNMPMIGSLSAIGSGTIQSNTPASSSLPAAPSEASPLFAQKVPSQSQQALQQTTSQKGVLPAVNKSRTAQAKPPSSIKLSTGPNPLIQKAAFAAGGRIANPSTAASLLKAAQSKNAVHIRHVGAFPISQAPVTKSSPSTITLTPRTPNTAQSRMASSVNPGMPPSVSGPGNQQAACSSSKTSLQVAPATDVLQRPLSQNLPGESRSASPVNDNAHGDSDNKSSLIGSATVASALSKGEVEGMEQPKVDSFSCQDKASAPEPMEIDGCTGEDQVSLVNLDVSDLENDMVDHDTSNNTASCDTSNACQGAMVNLGVGENSNLIADYVANDQIEMKPGAMAQNLEVMPNVDVGSSTDFVANGVVDCQPSICGSESGRMDRKLSVIEDQDTGRQSDENQNVTAEINTNEANVALAQDMTSEENKMLLVRHEGFSN